jgi:F420-non-reducing hydrogenase iron-sulfur subunit
MTGFEPKIVAFLCNWCSYAAADKAGAAQTPMPPNVQIVRVMCSGRVDPQLILAAFARGADGVLVLMCHPGDCHYKEGNFRAIQRGRILALMLEQLGLDRARLRYGCVSAADGDTYARLVGETVEAIGGLGPLSPRLVGPSRAGLDQEASIHRR